LRHAIANGYSFASSARKGRKICLRWSLLESMSRSSVE